MANDDGIIRNLLNFQRKSSICYNLSRHFTSSVIRMSTHQNVPFMFTDRPF